MIRLTICSLLTICNFSYFPFGFEGWIWVLIASVPGLAYFLLSVLPKFKNHTAEQAKQSGQIYGHLI